MPEQHFRLSSGIDITPLWHCYKLISKEKACKEGLSLVLDLQQTLSLSHIMLLVPQSNDKDMVDLFGADTLSSIYREIRDAYIDHGIELEASLAKNIKKTMRNLRDGNISRVKAVVELAILLENTGNEDAQIVQAIMNCVMKLPQTNTSSKIGEMELITNYLDPILSPMFHQPDHGRLFKWLNLKSKELSKADVNSRPDGAMTLNEQLNGVFALGFCEIKSMDAINRHNLTHTDTFRLAMFTKNAIDDNKTKCTLAVQSVGAHITFFLCALQSEGLYPFVKLGKITIPTCIGQLIDFTAHLDTLGQEGSSRLRKPSLTQLQISDMLSEYQAGQPPSILYM
ncbi:hypothetical protein G6F23_010833 [Rhizopus arrhizus]|nr:hypothetical protein G6F23_010833 [Rhizopus arrhizus]